VIVELADLVVSFEAAFVRRYSQVFGLQPDWTEPVLAPVRVVELQAVAQTAVKIYYSLELQEVHFRLNIQLASGSA
jgi:hypothetical protein